MAHKRYIELDLLRSLAIAGMILYHTAYDLQMFYGWDIDVFSGGWKLFQITIASLFLLLVGITAAVADDRGNTQKTPQRGVSTWHRAWKRFARIGAAALLVTIVTYIIDPETYVRFGILHLIAVTALILPIMGINKRRPSGASLRIGMGICIIGIGSFIHQWHTAGAWRFIGIPLGFPPRSFATVDYFPLIPWFGVILTGYAIGHLAYIQYPHWRRAPQVADLRLYTWLGRHSLSIYLIHQPIIIGILWMILGKPVF